MAKRDAGALSAAEELQSFLVFADFVGAEEDAVTISGLIDVVDDQDECESKEEAAAAAIEAFFGGGGKGDDNDIADSAAAAAALLQLEASPCSPSSCSCSS